MAETGPTAKAAEEISEKLLKVFGWELHPALNHDFDCATEAHGKNTHPCDAVFQYLDPTDGCTVLIHTDLKSYAKGTITPSNLRAAVVELALATDCTRRSRIWQEKHGRDGRVRYVGMLFVYNHDGEFDKDFLGMLDNESLTSVSIPPRTQVHVIGPEVINRLGTIAADIQSRDYELAKANGTAPGACRFFHPHRVDQHSVLPYSEIAPIETFSGPWMIVQTASGSSQLRYDVYPSFDGGDQDEFVYLFDYLFRIQLVQPKTRITIRLTKGEADYESSFERAKERYCYQFPAPDEMNTQLSTIRVERVRQFVFSHGFPRINSFGEGVL